MKSFTSQFYSEADFDQVEKIDAHVHFNFQETSLLQQAKKDNFRFISINVGPDYYPSINEQLNIASSILKDHHKWFSFATTFSINHYEDATWQDDTIRYIRNSLEKGAIAVKVWKNIGMEMKDKEGQFVMIDNPRFTPIFEFLTNANIPLIGHLGEPKNCWLPVNEMTVDGDRQYFSSHPEYHMYLHPDYPSYEDQIQARDQLLQNHPDLKFIGAHLGSMEWSVEEISKRLDIYPNLAVDLAQRISHLQYQAVNNWQQVHDFLIKYQDRILYGTDIEVGTSKTANQRNCEAHDIWMRHWRFFSSSEKMRVPKVQDEFKGMHLPRVVIDKLYRLNAIKWYNLRKYARD